jgi:hypothetical protein
LDFWHPLSRGKKAKKVGFDSNLPPSKSVNGFSPLTFFQFFSTCKILHFSGSPAGGGGEVLGVVTRREAEQWWAV